MFLPVLIVEGDPQLRSLIRVVLSRAGFRVLETGDGVSALSKVQDLGGEIGVVVSSYSVPQMDGAALASRVKEAFPQIPIVLLSCEANAPYCVGGDVFLSKPFPPSLLVATVHRLFGMEAKQCV